MHPYFSKILGVAAGQEVEQVIHWSAGGCILGQDAEYVWMLARCRKTVLVCLCRNRVEKGFIRIGSFQIYHLHTNREGDSQSQTHETISDWPAGINRWKAEISTEHHTPFTCPHIFGHNGKCSFLSLFFAYFNYCALWASFWRVSSL